MVRFQKRRRNFRRRGRRTAWYDKKYSTAQIARAAFRSAQYIRGLVNSEMFHLDDTHTLGSAQSSITPLCNITQGDSVSGRTGNSILLKSIAFSGDMYIHANVTTNTRVMLALVCDKQQVSDSSPSLANIFTSDVNPHTFLNVNNLGRFTIVWRKQYTLSPNASGNNARTIKIFTKINKHVRYNGTSGNDIQKNGYYLCMVTTESTNYPTIQLSSRVNYHDN
jgi:hypothetical protein